MVQATTGVWNIRVFWIYFVLTRNKNINDKKLTIRKIMNIVMNDFSKNAEFRAVDIIIPDETHTLGNLMQSYLYKYFMLKYIFFICLLVDFKFELKFSLLSYGLLPISYNVGVSKFLEKAK